MSEIKGKIILIHRIKEVSEKFKTQEIWVQETEGQYPQTFSIQFVNKNIEKLNSVNEGDNVTIGINLKGRLFTKKDGEKMVYNSIEGWSLKVDSRNVSVNTYAPNVDTTQDNENLPF